MQAKAVAPKRLRRGSGLVSERATARQARSAKAAQLNSWTKVEHYPEENRAGVQLGRVESTRSTRLRSP